VTNLEADLDRVKSDFKQVADVWNFYLMEVIREKVREHLALDLEPRFRGLA